MSGLLRAAVLFFSVTWPQRLSMKLTISLLLKNTIVLLFFSEHKLYEFLQRVIALFFELQFYF